MQLNHFLWSNYKESKSGAAAITSFSKTDFKSLKTVVEKHVKEPEDTIKLFEQLSALVLATFKNCNKSENAEEVYLSLMEGRVEIEDNLEFGIENYRKSFYNICAVSVWLYVKLPKFFIPYFFKGNFFELTRIADSFNIELPKVPLKRDKYARLKYYWDLCLVFKNFQEENNLNDAELCAFLYDYAPNYLRENLISNDHLPQPTQIWLVGGDKFGVDFGTLDSANADFTSFWQGNIDTHRGDIVIMYCLAPRSYIHSIWRATCDGFADPFFYFYGMINIGKCIKVPPIHISELKADTYFSKNPLVRKNLQGINGYNFSPKDYAHLLSLLAVKDFDLKVLPQLYRPEVAIDIEVKNEREVELKLVEPLLKDLGYSSNDWVRQMSVHMGRGERNIPDYVFFAKQEKGYEEGKMVLETKYHIKAIELEGVFKQARSYAMRLDSLLIVICDKEAIWIYERINGSFDRSIYIKTYWGEKSGESFQMLKLKIGRDRLMKVGRK